MPLRIQRSIDDTDFVPRQPTPAPTPAPSDSGSTGGSGNVGSVPTPSDPTTGSDGSGTGALSAQIAPAVVIGMNMLRDALGVEPPVSVAPEVTLAGKSTDRRNRARYTDKTIRPSTSGIRL